MPASPSRGPTETPVAQIDVAAALARFPVFDAMTVEARERLAAAGTPVSLPHGSYLFRRGDPGDAVYVLLSGAAEVTRADEEGRVSVLARLEPGDIAGEMGAVSGRPRSADICIVRRAELWRIGAGAVRGVLEAEGRAAMALVSLLVTRLNETDDLVQRAQWLDVEARLAQLLMEREQGSSTLSQGELARLIGASREAVNRRLSEWRRRGWVEIDERGLHVRRPEALAALYEGIGEV